ncbi:Sugar phosphate isomerase/epimerase [Peptostreptococcaceae bacterium pGA-8]|nr:Sugar phosphate isomerase/epimerase [Peptostreptococcaceae bacterium pGA-8]
MEDKKKLSLKERLHAATFSEAAINVAREIGIGLELNHVCISENLDSDKIERTYEGILRDIEESRADHLILHGPFTEICPGSIDHRAVDMGLERLEEAAELATRLNLNSMVVHSGYMPMIYYKEWHLEKSLKFWDRFLKGKPDFTIFVENVFDDEPYMMKKLVDDFNDPRLKLCLDVGHANVLTTKELPVTRWIEILGKRIGHFHLHNNQGDKDTHQPLGEGTLYMREILRAIEENCEDDVSLTLESTKCAACAQWLSCNGYI